MWCQADHPAIRVVPALGLAAIFRQFCVHVLQMHCVQSMALILDVTSSGGAVTSCVMSWHRTCTCHMTFCYKRLADASLKALLAPFSSFWSLLPSSVITVLALVNSAVSHRGHPTPCQYHFHRTAVPFSWCPCALWQKRH